MTADLTPLDGATLVFDLDGTLAETAPDLIDVLNEVLEERGAAPLPPQTVRPLIGHGAKALLKRGLDAAGVAISGEDLDTLTYDYVARYEKRLTRLTHMYEDLETELDRAAAAGARLAVCTNKFEALSRRLLEELGVLGRFQSLVGADTCSTKKPDAAPLLHAIAEAGGEPARALMVGDSDTDVGAARAAGVPIVLVSFGYTETPAHELDHDALIDSYAGFCEVAAGLLERD
jgi:phosphoglycolate phosphatase